MFMKGSSDNVTIALTRQSSVVLAGALAASSVILYCGYNALLPVPIILILAGAYLCGTAVVLPFALAKIKRLVAGASWLHGVWALLFISSLNLRTRTGNELMQNPIDTAALFRILLVMIAGGLVIPHTVLRLSKVIPEVVKGPIALFTLYVAFAAVSSLYSSYPPLTLWKSFELVVDMSVIALLFVDTGPAERITRLLDLMWLLLVMLIAVMGIGAIVAPGWATTVSEGVIKRQLGGVLMSANGVGEIGAIIGIVSFSRLSLADDRRDRLLYLLVFIFAVLVMVLSQSRTPVVAFAVAFIVLLVIMKRWSTAARYFYCGALAALLAFIYRDAVLGYFNEFFMRGQSREVFGSLTGRIPMWHEAKRLIAHNLFFGYGFGTGSRITFMTSYMRDFTAVHNAWIEIALNLGIAGFASFTIAFVRLWYELLAALIRYRVVIAQARLFRYLIEAIAVLAVLSVETVTSSGIGAWQSYSVLAYLAILALANVFYMIRKHRT